GVSLGVSAGVLPIPGAAEGACWAKSFGAPVTKATTVAILPKKLRRVLILMKSPSNRSFEKGRPHREGAPVKTPTLPLIACAQSNQSKGLNATSVVRMRKRNHWTRRGLDS